MLGMKRTGPIGLDFGMDNLKIAQTDFVKGRPIVRYAAVLPYVSTKNKLFEISADLKKMMKEARAQGGLKGNHVVVSMPPGNVQFVSLEYKCQAGQNADEAVLDAIRDRFGERIGNSVIDFLHIRPEHKDQTDRAALVAVAEQKLVIDFLDFLNKAGLFVDRLEIGPVAINRLICAMNPTQNDKISMVINFGLKKSYVTVLWGRRILLDREIAFGQETAVNQIAEALEVSTTEASILLERHGVKTQQKALAGVDCMEPGIDETIIDILKPSLLSLSTEIKRLTLYIASRTRGREISNAYILGSVVTWSGIDKTLTEMIGIPLEIKMPFYGLETTSQAKNNSSLGGLAVATGLSLCGMENE